MARTLGLDWGEKRIGVAVSDPLGITAQGVEVITYDAPKEALNRLCALCEHYSVGKIVIGLPLRMNGTAGETARRVQAFGDALEKTVERPVVMIDERLTSRMAEKALLEGDRSRAGRRRVRDLLAAMLILESFLERDRSPRS